MCTMLSLVAGVELKISRSRLLRFLEAYIGACSGRMLKNANDLSTCRNPRSLAFTCVCCIHAQECSYG